MSLWFAGAIEKRRTATSGLGPLSEVGARNRHVRFPPDSDHTADIAGGPFRANSGHRGPDKIKSL
jgi:hypothetical protein